MSRKEKLKDIIENILTPKNIVYVVLGVVALIAASLLFVDTTIKEQEAQNMVYEINLESTGNGNVYVRDGVIVSFKNIYYDNNYIALQVKTTSTNGDLVKITYGIKDLEQQFTYETDKEHYEYLIIGDSQNSTYNVDIKIEQYGRVVAEGVVVVTHDIENSVIFTMKEVVYLDNDMEIFFLGKEEDSYFLTVKNSSPNSRKVTFTHSGGYFYFGVEGNEKKYLYLAHMGGFNFAMGIYDIQVEDLDAGDIQIEEVDGTE